MRLRLAKMKSRLSDYSQARWGFISRAVMPAALAVAVLIVLIALLFEKSISTACECSALVSTFMLCVFTYRDIMHYGDHKIHAILDPKVSVTLDRKMKRVYYVLSLSIYCACFPSPLEWLSAYWQMIHAVVVTVGAWCALGVSQTLANMAVNRALFDQSQDELCTIKDEDEKQRLAKLLKQIEDGVITVANEHRTALEALQKEHEVADELSRVADKPLVAGYFFVLFAVCCACINGSSTAELRMFIGGSVALGLGSVNWAHMTLRKERGPYG